MTSGKITTAPRLVSEYFIKTENKHQIMNVHTKRNVLIPILSSLVMTDKGLEPAYIHVHVIGLTGDIL